MPSERERISADGSDTNAASDCSEFELGGGEELAKQSPFKRDMMGPDEGRRSVDFHVPVVFDRQVVVGAVHSAAVDVHGQRRTGVIDEQRTI